MGVLYFLVGISVVGVAAVFWLIKNEQNAEGVPLKDLEPSVDPAVIPASKPMSLLNLLNKFSFGKKTGETPESEILQHPDSFPLGNLFAKEQKKEEFQVQGVVPLVEAESSLSKGIGEELKLSVVEEKKIDHEIELMAQLDEIKEQNKNLDRLFKEKSAALEKAEASLENELRNRKEFNKVKDILEKELKESKDRSRELQMELGSAKAESDNYQKRVNELAEKVAELERQVIQRNDEVANLTKRLQTFASPATAATPPRPEGPKAGDVVASQETVKPQPHESSVPSSGESTPGIIDLSRLKEEKPEASGDDGKNSQTT